MRNLLPQSAASVTLCSKVFSRCSPIYCSNIFRKEKGANWRVPYMSLRARGNQVSPYRPAILINKAISGPAGSTCSRSVARTDNLRIIIQVIFIRMRPQANGVNLSLSFQSDPGLKQIRCAVTHASSMFLDFDFRN